MNLSDSVEHLVYNKCHIHVGHLSVFLPVDVFYALAELVHYEYIESTLLSVPVYLRDALDSLKVSQYLEFGQEAVGLALALELNLYRHLLPSL